MDGAHSGWDIFAANVLSLHQELILAASVVSTVVHACMIVCILLCWTLVHSMFRSLVSSCSALVYRSSSSSYSSSGSR
jgi:hypothetical protein